MSIELRSHFGDQKRWPVGEFGAFMVLANDLRKSCRSQRVSCGEPRTVGPASCQSFDSDRQDAGPTGAEAFRFSPSYTLFGNRCA
jgi:hypothetical protein